MARLEDITPGTSIKGILPNSLVTIEKVTWFGSVIDVIFKDPNGKLGNQLIPREEESTIEIIEKGSSWAFDAEGDKFKLTSEALRIRLAHLFDPLLAIHTSNVLPLPHQITAVYEEMLQRQPLRFLLADDPGAGKTIMAGLLIRELLIRGDLENCLICCPGSLAEQWQDEMWNRFHLEFKIISKQTIEESRSGNPYKEHKLVISRLDHMSRNEFIQEKLRHTEWDLVIVDEAHKMAAHYFNNEVKETKRFKLGKLIGSANLTRHFLLMTATPHNGKEEDFQLFLSLLDGDRFEGKFRDGVHSIDPSDIMRRLVKEDLVRFDGKPLFPERIAYTVPYILSEPEAALYKMVTDYVRDEMNRADKLEGRRGNRVGFALTALQRRLASSPEAIYKSLCRRREKLEKKLREVELDQRGAKAIFGEDEGPDFSDEDLDDFDDAPEEEMEELVQKVVEQASASETIEELKAEIETLKKLVQKALEVKNSGIDRKWEELSKLLSDMPEMFDPDGLRRKLIIFTEHRDTLNYLSEKIKTLLGSPEFIVMIHGGLGRERRGQIQEAFTQDKDVHILVATDAAGEGVNLQRAHLLINYDLPWNPNRLEQRFGRIHRIGQTEVCHMWSLVAKETREGDVFSQLLTKLETERKALGGGVFDVLGRVFDGHELRHLLIEAIRYGERPEVKAKLDQIVNHKIDRKSLQELLDARALVKDVLDSAKIQRIREEMERAETRKLQPHFIRSFFLEAFQHFGGTIHKREQGRYEITRVPSVIRYRDRQIGVGEVILSKYERITFDKEFIRVQGKPLATFVCPGHTLLDSTLDVVLERFRNNLRQGAILIDDNDEMEDPHLFYFLEHSVQDARNDRYGNRRVVSKRLLFIKVSKSGNPQNAGYAPYLDYRPLKDGERKVIEPILQSGWLHNDHEGRILEYAIAEIVPKHLKEVKDRKEESIAKVKSAVHERLTKEINYWDHYAQELKQQEEAGRNPKINYLKAKERADDLQTRYQRRMSELEQERKISSQSPIVLGGALVIPNGLLKRLLGERTQKVELYSTETARIEQLAMQKVMDVERSLGFEPLDVSKENCGYDVESKSPVSDNESDLQKPRLRFIEVKGRAKGASQITITKNEILTSLNNPDQYILAIVIVDGDRASEPVYVRQPCSKEPDFGVASVNYKLLELIDRGEKPL